MYDKAKNRHGQYDFWLRTSVTMPVPSTDLNQFFAVSVNNIVMVHQMLWVKFLSLQKFNIFSWSILLQIWISGFQNWQEKFLGMNKDNIMES
jgi:hypothetical protein